jgi:hypothetical protein
MMRVFEVALNGERLCVAGAPGDGVVTVVLHQAHDEIRLSVGGLLPGDGEQVTWAENLLQTGDEVRIAIRESGNVDAPVARHAPDRERDLDQQRAYVRNMAKKLGWTLVEG